MNKYFNVVKPLNRTLHINFYKDVELYNQIKEYSRFYGCSMQSFVKGCVEEFIKGGKL